MELNFLIVSIAVTLFIFLITFISVYNECKALVIQISECAADIESSNIKLNRVATEISSLLHKYSIHESDVFNAIVSGNSNIKMLGIKYPQLKADNMFLSASTNWESLYNQLQKSVGHYNHKITEYNIVVTNFPKIIFCLILNFKSKNHAKIT
jgi:LemA protein